VQQSEIHQPGDRELDHRGAVIAPILARIERPDQLLDGETDGMDVEDIEEDSLSIRSSAAEASALTG
jgi:hypothetical protein